MASGTQQLFSLRWNNHTNSILQGFLEQYTSEMLVDVTLSCQGKFLKAHKMVVAACSPYFKDLFNDHDTPHPIVILNGIKYDVMKAIIEFMYRGEVKVEESALDSLLELAETLQVTGLSHIRKKDSNTEKTMTAADTKSVETTQEAAESVGSRSATNATMEDIHKNEVPEPSSPPPSVEPIRASTKRSSRAAVVRVRINDRASNDEDDLSSMIKVEPPDIRDIDDDSPEDWPPTRLVIDLPEMTPDSKSEPSNSQFVICESNETRLPSGQSKGNACSERDENPNLSSLELKIPRPPNAFMIFANEWRRKLAYQHPTENNKEISVRLGVMWKSLSAETKEGYYVASREADIAHKRKYPGYYYSPKEARLRKRLKKKHGNAALEAMQLVRVLMNNDDDDEDDETTT